MFVHSDKQQCTACVVLLAAYSQRVRCVLWSQLTRALGMHICSIYIRTILLCVIHTYVHASTYMHIRTYVLCMYVCMYVCAYLYMYKIHILRSLHTHSTPTTTDGAPLTLRLCPSVTSATKGGAPFLKYGAICLHSSACVESLSNACVLVEL